MNDANNIASTPTPTPSEKKILTPPQKRASDRSAGNKGQKQQSKRIARHDKRTPHESAKNSTSVKAERPCIVCAIVERGKSVKIRELWTKHGVFFTFSCMGQGTAGSEIMDILGLENSEKDIVAGFATGWAAHAVMSELNDRLAGSFGSKGIAFQLALTAAPKLFLTALEMKSSKTHREDISKMDDQVKYSLILITVNQGYTDEVMAAAKKAGARGGTLIRARQTLTQETEGLFGSDFTPEREIIAILASADKRNSILESVNTEHGVRSEANAVAISLAVEDIAKLS